MRILHFYKTYYPDTVGGGEQVINQLCRGTERLGVTSSVLTLTKSSENLTLTQDGHTVHRVKRDFQIASNDFSFSAIKKFATLVKEFDIVHYHFPWPFMDLAHFVVGVKCPTIVTYHSDIVRQQILFRLYSPFMHRFLNDVDRIVATSPNYLATSPVLNKHKNKVDVIPIGIDKRGYPESSAGIMEKLRKRVGERFFLFVGLIRYYKGLQTLLDALSGVDYPVVIAGSGPFEGQLKQQALRLGLKNIIFLGSVSEEEKVALLKLCYAFVFPSHLRSEAFGISLLEGAMFGKPMISCEIGTGTSYINIDNQTGIVVPPSDPTAFRNAMRHLWESPGLAAEMGARAEERYWKLFTADQMAVRYVEVYKELLAER